MKGAFSTLAIVLLCCVVGSNARDLLGGGGNACTPSTPPGTVCVGTVNNQNGRRCVQPLSPDAPGCPTGLLQVCSDRSTVARERGWPVEQGDRAVLQVVSSVVNANTAAAGSCGTGDGSGGIPCCDASDGVRPLCIDLEVGCIAAAKLCVGGLVGGLVNAVTGPLTIEVANPNTGTPV